MQITRPDLYLYMVDEDVYRLGNSSTPKLDNVRRHDVDTYVHKGIKYIRANGKGVSLLTEERAKITPGWLWRIPKSTHMPAGLALNPDRPGHISLCPVKDMNMHTYCGLLLELAGHCEKVRKQ